jgi:hypothetical protein
MCMTSCVSARRCTANTSTYEKNNVCPYFVEWSIFLISLITIYQLDMYIAYGKDIISIISFVLWSGISLVFPPFTCYSWVYRFPFWCSYIQSMNLNAYVDLPYSNTRREERMTQLTWRWICVPSKMFSSWLIFEFQICIYKGFCVPSKFLANNFLF